MSVRGFFGGLFLAIGWLIAILSGGCVLFIACLSFLSFVARLYEGDFNFEPLVLMVLTGFIFGGIPFLIGIKLIGKGLFFRDDQGNESDNKTNMILKHMRDREILYMQTELEKIDEEDKDDQ